MSMHQVIKEAVRSALAHQNRPLPVTYQETMGGTYFYNATSIKNFLKAVSELLASDMPPYAFDPRSLELADCVNARVIELQAMIAANTKLV